MSFNQTHNNQPLEFQKETFGSNAFVPKPYVRYTPPVQKARVKPEFKEVATPIYEMERSTIASPTTILDEFDMHEEIEVEPLKAKDIPVIEVEPETDNEFSDVPEVDEEE